MYFPTLAAGLEIILAAASDSGPILRARNVVDRLAFGHLRPAYLRENAIPTLESLEPTWTKIEELQQIRDSVQESDRANWTPASLSGIASAAQKLRAAAPTFFKSRGRELLVEISRHGFGRVRPTNMKRVARASKAFLLFGSFSNSASGLAASLRKELAKLDPAQDSDALRVAVQEALEAFWKDTSVEAKWTVVLEAGDVAVRAGTFEVYGLKFYNPAVTELLHLGMTVERGGPPEFLESEPARIATHVIAAIGDADRAFSVARERVDLVLACAAVTQERLVPHRGRAAIAFFDKSSYRISSGTIQPPGPRWWAELPEIEILRRRFTEYIGPLLSGEIGDEEVREGFRRSVLSFSDALAAKTLGLGALAVSAMWTALEVILLDHEQDGRGAVLARRLSSFAIAEDSVRIDEVVNLEPEDVAAFAADYRVGRVKRRPHIDSILREHERDPEFMLIMLQMDCMPDLLAWKGDQHRRSLKDLPQPERDRRIALHTRSVIAQVSDWYRLRNDVVHAGYSDTGLVDIIFQELVELYRGFILNYAFNVTKHGTRVRLIRRMDEVFEARVSRFRSELPAEDGSSASGSQRTPSNTTSANRALKDASEAAPSPSLLGGVGVDEKIS